MVIDFLAGELSLSLDEVILFLKTLALLFADLLFAELGCVVVLLSHSVEVVLHGLLLLANLVNGRLLLRLEVPVAIHDLLAFFLATLALGLLLGFRFHLALLLFAMAHEDLVVVLVLQILEFSGLFLRLFDLLDRADLLVLKHTHSVAKLLYVALKLQSD